MATINVQSGTATVTTTETTIVEIQSSAGPYEVIEGYIDISNLPTDTKVLVKEYIDIDGNGYRLFAQFEIDTITDFQLVRFHSKLVPTGGRYKVTMQVIEGSSFDVPYWFASTGLT